MNKINWLIVGGTFDEKGGRPSGFVDKFTKDLHNIKVINGGYYSSLTDIVDSIGKDGYEYVLWWANIPNDLPKIRDIKSLYPNIMLVTSKRNNKEYSKQEIIARALRDKANLIVEFDKTEGLPFRMRVSDPLGNVFYNGKNLEEMQTRLLARIIFLKGGVTRRKTYISGKESSDAKVDERFLEIVKGFANRFHELINPMESTRFLGNASQRFRCERGFPSQRLDDNRILVSRRNVRKESLQSSEFVEVYEEYDKLYFNGKYKPSVDTPIQFELYKRLPKINYMVHSHVYVKSAPCTRMILPCGALEEIDEIMEVVNKYGYSENFCINLKGHGCTIFASDLDYFDKIEFIERELD